MTTENYHQKMNHWLAEMGEGLILNENGSCAVQYGEDRYFFIDVPPENPTFYLSTRVIAVPAENQAAFLSQVLTLNLYQNETRGASLALDPEAGNIVLVFSRDLEETDDVFFKNLIPQFLETAAQLEIGLTEFCHGATQNDSQRPELQFIQP